MARKDWSSILERAAEIVDSYDTRVTLRQLFYRLVSEQVLANTRSDYTTLSARTAEARRAGWFPSLFDRTRTIHRAAFFDDPAEAFASWPEQFRLDRTAGQDVQLWLGVEKNGLVEQLYSWFSPLGLPVIALAGYSSQTYVDDVVEDVEIDGRPAVLLYAGDFDPSGEDSERDFTERTGCWKETRRIALTPEQVLEYDLPPMLGKSTDTRAAQFRARHGRLVQVEVDALAPDVLRGLFQSAMDEFWQPEPADEVLEHEDRHRVALDGFAALVGRSDAALERVLHLAELDDDDLAALIELHEETGQ